MFERENAPVLFGCTGSPGESRCLTKLVKTSKTAGLHGRMRQGLPVTCGQSCNFACEIDVSADPWLRPAAFAFAYGLIKCL